MLITCILKTFLGNRESKYLGAIPDSQTIVRSVDGRSVGRSVGWLVGGIFPLPIQQQSILPQTEELI